MKIVELTGSISIPITNEESDLLLKFATNEAILKKSLDERQKEIASSLVNKGLLTRKNDDGEIKYFNSSRSRKNS